MSSACGGETELREWRASFDAHAPCAATQDFAEFQVSDYTGATALLDSLPKAGWLPADRGYDGDWFKKR